MNRRLISLFVVCSSLYSVSGLAYASDAMRYAPLKVYVPNIASVPVTMPTVFIANKLEYNPQDAVVEVKGQVEIEHEGTTLKADKVEYDQIRNMVTAKGNVQIVGPDGIIHDETVELSDNLKEGIVKSFKAELASNDKFMAAEKKKLPAGGETEFADNKKSLFDQALEKLISDPHEEDAQNLAVITPAAYENKSYAMSKINELANLAPAAGGELNVGNEPLIKLDEEEPKPPVPAPAPAVPAPAAPPEVPAVQAAPVAPVEAISPSDIKLENKPEDGPVPVTLPAVVPAEEVKPVVDLQKIITPVDPATLKPQDTVEKAPVVNQLEKAIEKPAETVVPEPKAEPKLKDKPEKKTEKKNTKKPDDKKKADTKKKADKKIEDAVNSEPQPELPAASRKLLKQVSPSVPKDEVAKDVKPFNLNRTRDMQDLFKADEITSSPQSEVMGVRVETKRPGVNLDSELDKAYNAISSGQSDVAIDIYKNVLDNSPNNTQALFGLATLYHRARQFDKARPLYGRLLAINPDHRDGFNNFLVLLADEAPNEALRELEKLEAKNPGFSTIPAQIAVIYQKTGKPEKAIDKMFRAVALAPENLIYRYNLAIMLDKQKNYDEAAKIYKQLLEASARGEKIPGNIDNIQQRLTFISSNR